MAYDWLTLQNEYLQTTVSLRALAQKHGVSYAAVTKIAAREGWAALRRAGKLMETPTEENQAVKKKPTQKSTKPTLRETAHGRPSTKPKIPKAKRALHSQPTNEIIANEKPEVDPYGDKSSTQPLPKADRLAQLMDISDRLTEQLARATGELAQQVIKHKRKNRREIDEDAQAKNQPACETMEENYQLEIVTAPVNCTGLQRLSATLKNLREVALANSGDEQGVGMVAELMKKLDDEVAKEDA